MPRDTKVKKIENGHLRVGTPKNSREVKLNFKMVHLVKYNFTEI